MELDIPGEWHANWAWGVPLIVLNVVVHVLGLGFISQKVVSTFGGMMHHRHFTLMFAVAMSITVLLVTLLHSIEAIVWAAAYRLLGALPDNGTAMLYSLSAITSYGHADVALAAHWRLLGALEALNGMMLFGLTTAFLFSMIQRVWPLGSRGRAMKVAP